MRKTARKLSKHNKAISNQKGMTLIDVSIALMVIGLLIAPALYALKEYRAERARNVTNENIAAVDTAIRNYFIDNNFYPCPADPTLPRNNNAHGASLATAAGVCTITNTTGLAQGSVPHTELGLDIKHVYDGWGNKLLYAVNNSLASNTTSAPPSGPSFPLTVNTIPLVPNPALPLGSPECFIIDSQICADTIPGYTPGTSPACSPAFLYPPLPGDPGYTGLNSVHYTLVSHGEDGRGAFTDSGTPIPGPACNGATSPNEENCDGDATFQTRQCVNNNTPGANYYDDYVVANAEQKTTNPVAMLSQSDANDDGIAMGMEFVGINNSDPRRELAVIGNIKISDLDGVAGDDKDGAARASNYCRPVPITGNGTIPQPSECFEASLIGGSDLFSPCPAGSTMVGIRDNDAICEPVLNATATNCPNGISSITGGVVTCAP